MNLLEYSIETKDKLQLISISDFAKYFCDRYKDAWHYHRCDKCNECVRNVDKLEPCQICNNGIVLPCIGADFFSTVIKYWDNPKTYPVEKLDKPLPKFKDYNANFILFLELNKNRT